MDVTGRVTRIRSIHRLVVGRDIALCVIVEVLEHDQLFGSEFFVTDQVTDLIVEAEDRSYRRPIITR